MTNEEIEFDSFLEFREDFELLVEKYRESYCPERYVHFMGSLIAKLAFRCAPCEGAAYSRLLNCIETGKLLNEVAEEDDS